MGDPNRPDGWSQWQVCEKKKACIECTCISRLVSFSLQETHQIDKRPLLEVWGLLGLMTNGTTKQTKDLKLTSLQVLKRELYDIWIRSTKVKRIRFGAEGRAQASDCNPKRSALAQLTTQVPCGFLSPSSPHEDELAVGFVLQVGHGIAGVPKGAQDLLPRKWYKGHSSGQITRTPQSELRDL